MFVVTIGASRLPLIVSFMAALTACSDGKPAHYYVLCEANDYNGWRLVATYKNDAGYLLSCTYQSPDRQQTYTASCGSEGCD